MVQRKQAPGIYRNSGQQMRRKVRWCRWSASFFYPPFGCNFYVNVTKITLTGSFHSISKLIDTPIVVLWETCPTVNLCRCKCPTDPYSFHILGSQLTYNILTAA